MARSPDGRGHLWQTVYALLVGRTNKWPPLGRLARLHYPRRALSRWGGQPYTPSLRGCSIPRAREALDTHN